MSSSLAVILLSYKRPQNMGVIVRSVLKALPDAAVFILDQADRDDLRRRPDIPWDKIQYKHAQVNTGAGARVSLASTLQFDLFVSIDDDMFLEPEQIERLAELLRAEPDRAHGIWGERLEFDQGRIRFRSGIRRLNIALSNLNQVYAFSRVQALAAIELSAQIGFASWQDVVVGNDILLTCASQKLPLCHDLGPMKICATSSDDDIAIWRRNGFRERRAEIARRLVCAKAIGVFPTDVGLTVARLTEPISGEWAVGGTGPASHEQAGTELLSPSLVPASRHVGTDR